MIARRLLATSGPAQSKVCTAHQTTTSATKPPTVVYAAARRRRDLPTVPASQRRQRRERGALGLSVSATLDASCSLVWPSVWSGSTASSIVLPAHHSLGWRQRPV